MRNLHGLRGSLALRFGRPILFYVVTYAYYSLWFKNKNLRAFSPPMSPRMSYNTDKFADQANKEKIRLLTEEM